MGGKLSNPTLPPYFLANDAPDLKDSEDEEGHVDDGMIVVLAGS